MQQFKILNSLRKKRSLYHFGYEIYDLLFFRHKHEICKTFWLQNYVLTYILAVDFFCTHILLFDKFHNTADTAMFQKNIPEIFYAVNASMWFRNFN